MFAEAGTHDVTIPSYQGYDSVVVMTLHVNPVSTTSVSQTVCDSLIWEGITYTQSGIYTRTFANQFGCDSIVTVHLIVNVSDSVNIAQTACDFYAWAGETYTQSGVYTKTFTNRFGCDSVVTLTLTVNPSSVAAFDTAVCGAFVWNGEVYPESGVYAQTLENRYGCDSIVTAYVTVHYADTVQFDTLVCPQSLPVTVRGFTFTEAGTYGFAIVDDAQEEFPWELTVVVGENPAMEQLYIDTALEDHDDVRAAELEEAHLVAPPEALADVQLGYPVDAADLGHAYRKHGHEAELLGLDDGAGARLHHLEAHGVLVLVEFSLVVPHRIAAPRRNARDATQLAQHATHGSVVAVVAVHVEEGVRQRAAGEGFLILAVLADEPCDVVDFLGLDIEVSIGIYELIVIVDAPCLLWP
jgi:hypothetical protein